MDNETLQQIFSEAGEEYGLTDVSAEFAAFKDMKVRWIRSVRCIELTVTDYLKEAPEEIVNGFAKHLLDKIFNGSEEEYPEDFAAWLTSDRFRELNREIYLQRSRALPEDYKSNCHDLKATYEGLVAKGLLEEIPDVTFRWTDGRCDNPMGVSSFLMKSVIVPTYMDCDAISEQAFEFNLYRLMTNLTMGFGIDPSARKMIADSMLESFPDSEELSSILESKVHLLSCEVD